MRDVLGAVFLIFSVFSSSAGAQDCSCTEAEYIFHFDVVNQDDRERMENYFWRFESAEPIYDLTQTGEPVIGCKVWVNLVFEDDPALEAYEPDADGNEKILVGTDWVRFDQLEEKLRAPCTLAMS